MVEVLSEYVLEEELDVVHAAVPVLVVVRSRVTDILLVPLEFLEPLCVGLDEGLKLFDVDGASVPRDSETKRVNVHWVAEDSVVECVTREVRVASIL